MELKKEDLEKLATEYCFKIKILIKIKKNNV